jgi:hypothetical protein
MLADYTFYTLLRVAKSMHMTDPPTAASAMLTLMTIAVALPLADIVNPGMVMSDGAPVLWGAGSVVVYLAVTALYSSDKRLNSTVNRVGALSKRRRLACQVFFAFWVFSAVMAPISWVVSRAGGA